MLLSIFLAIFVGVILTTIYFFVSLKNNSYLKKYEQFFILFIAIVCGLIAVGLPFFLNLPIFFDVTDQTRYEFTELEDFYNVNESDGIYETYLVDENGEIHSFFWTCELAIVPRDDKVLKTDNDTPYIIKDTLTYKYKNLFLKLLIWPGVLETYKYYIYLPEKYMDIRMIDKS